VYVPHRLTQQQQLTGRRLSRTNLHRIIEMCDMMMDAHLSRPPAASFDLLDFAIEDFNDLMGHATTTCTTRKRERDANCLDPFFFDDDQALDSKKSKLEDAVEELLGAHVEDDDFTSKFRDLPHFAGNDNTDFDIGELLFGEEDEMAAIAMTPPRTMERSASATTPPMSPLAETEEEPSALLPFPRHLDQPRSTFAVSMFARFSRASSDMAVLSDNLMDLDTIAAYVDGKNLNVPVGGVHVEECSLSMEQKAKHALWFTKRKRCLTGHRGYKCPAKSRAAKKKVRANGRFNHKK